LANIPNLRSLEMRSQNIKVIPSEFAPLADLEDLDLSGNPLDENQRKKAKMMLPRVNINF
jgi:Leucine-rich repeat (LRR) protein